MNKRVSIIVPIYNAETYLNDCINSLIQQTYTNIEIILVDDGSIDCSREQIKKYAEIDARIKYLFQDNYGPSSARNKGIDLSSGDYILFVDSDDWIERDMIEVMIKQFERSNVDIVLCDYFLESNESYYQKIMNKLEYEIYKIDYVKYLLSSTDNLNSQCNRIYKSSIIKENRLYFNEDLKVGEDQIFNIEYFNLINKISYIDKAYYHYRVVKNSTCRKVHSNQVEMLISQQKIRNKLISQWKSEFFNYQVGSAKWFLQTTSAYCFLSIYTLEFEEALDIIKRLVNNDVCIECLTTMRKSKIKFDSNIHKMCIPLINTQRMSVVISGLYIFKSVYRIKDFISKNYGMIGG